MDKNTYETYEYMPVSNEDNDTNQFFVVQDDGTFLSINRPIQYVTQVEDVKEGLDGGVQPCAVYDVNPQQFYVDVDQSPELISVSDQFMIPEGDNNVYPNSYFLQSEESTKEVQMEIEQEDNEEQITEITDSSPNTVEGADVNIEYTEETVDNKANGDCTEITLSDEQYQLLEQKGWILLELGDKIFLLDTSGLHDITEDEKLIQKLKSESKCDQKAEITTNTIKIEKVDEYENTNEDSPNVGSSHCGETVQYVIGEDGIMQDDENLHEVSAYEEQVISKPQVKSERETIKKEYVINNDHSDYVKLNSVEDTYIKKENDKLKIKTKFLFKDIPSEIVLGKTMNGKKLVARVVKSERPIPVGNLNKNQTNYVENEANDEQLQACLSEKKFQSLIQQALWGTKERCTVKDVTAAETVVEQLLRVPAFRPAVTERRLLVTKVIILEDETGQNYDESYPSLVTGRVVREASKGWRFIFLPDMLRKMMKVKDKDADSKRKDEDEDTFLHIHVRETKGADGIIRISITLNKRPVPLKLKTNFILMREPKTVFACSTCAAIYKTEEGLKLHQETECMETDNILTIDTDSNTNEAFSILINSGKDKQYICNLCNTIFSKLSNCEKHIKTHINQEEISETEKGSSDQGKEDDTKKEGIFKCKMCPSTYFHAATLSKHIVNKHIKMWDN